MTNGKSLCRECLDRMDFDTIYQMGQEIASDACDVVYFHGPRYVEDKESSDGEKFIGDYMEENHPEELKKKQDDEADEADLEGERICNDN